MPSIKCIPYIKGEEIDHLIGQLNRWNWFKQEFSCIDFAAAIWYHFYKTPIFPSTEETKKAQSKIDHMSRYFLYLPVYEDEISRDQIPHLPNLTIILQASHKRAIPLHASTLLVDEKDGMYIIEKDGQESPATLNPLAEWRTYQDEYPTYSAHTFGAAKILLDDTIGNSD